MRLFAKPDSFARYTLIVLGALLCPMAIAQSKQPQDKKPAPPPRMEMRRAVSVETRPQLFATLCALDAAGFDSSVNTTNQSPGRVKLRERMLALQGPAVEALRTYYQEHRAARARRR